MAFTKINAAGIGSTETVTLDGLTVINDGSFGGNVSVGGTLTYEDVTNVDSVGLITARAGVVVGSGITLSKDGDGFFTGIITATTFVGAVTGNVTGNISGGTVAGSTGAFTGNLSITKNDPIISFDDNDGTPDYYIGNVNGGFRIRDTSNNVTRFQVNTDGHIDIAGNTDFGAGIDVTGDVTATGHLDLTDSGRIKLGTDDDLQLYHNGSNAALNVTTGSLFFQRSGSAKILFDTNGDLGFYDNSKAYFGDSADLIIFHDGNNSVIRDNGTGQLYFQHGTSNKFNTQSGGVQFYGSMYADDNDKIELGNDQDLKLYHDGTSSVLKSAGHPIAHYSNTRHHFLNADGSANVAVLVTGAQCEFYHNGDKKISTSSTGMQLEGDSLIDRSLNSNTPVIQVTNSSYAKSLYVGGWEGGLNTSGISRIRNSNDNLHIDSGSAGEIYLNAYSDNVTRSRHFRPTVNDLYDLGGNGIRWDDIFATNGTINTSDRNEKNTITESDLGLSFVNKLKPVSYKFNGKTRTHYGLIAQDVETVLSDISKSTTDFAGFIKTDLPDEFYQEAEPNIPEGKKEGDLKTPAHTEYGLRYTEFISPLIKAVQELSAKNEALEARIKTLEG